MRVEPFRLFFLDEPGYRSEAGGDDGVPLHTAPFGLSGMRQTQPLL